tara:strand:- start:1898 stop:2299 length:402 start_codon:yes stop_codon:yes gene_type:complete
MAITASVTRGFTYSTGIEISAANLNELGEPTVTVATPIAVGNGGTNATTASAARTNLGLGTIATQASNSVSVTGGSMSGVLITLPSYAVSALPSAGTAGRVVFCTDGDGGSKCLAVDDGTNWKRVALGATVST